MDQSSGRKNAVLIIIGLVACVGILFFVLNYNTGSNTNTEVAQNPTPVPTSTFVPATDGKVEGWQSIVGVTPLRVVVPLSYLKSKLLVFKIGTIKTGEYLGKILAIAIDPNDSKLTGDPTKDGTYFYAYFISDEKGNPLAWDDAYFHDPDDRCFGNLKVQGCEVAYAEEDALGLTANLRKSLAFLPQELSKMSSFVVGDSHAQFSLSGDGRLIPPDTSHSLPQSVAITSSGFQVVKTETENEFSSLYPTYQYYVLMPFGSAIEIAPQPDFVAADEVPKLTWSTGTKTVQVYRFGQYAYGWSDCFTSLSEGRLEGALIETGKTANGASVYEVDPVGNDAVYQCLHEKTKRYDYDPVTQTGVYKDTVSYADFIQSHPMFFWKHPYGDLIAFIREDVVPAAEKAKPVIYLYPQKNEKVSVKVKPVGGFTTSIPAYEDGWNVNATPQGAITNMKDGKNYPYLFWEGGKDGIVETPKEGFVVAKGDVAATLQEKLTQFGLTKKEQNDFLEFWVPKLSQAPYYFLTFISEGEINRVAPLDINPRPDTVIRVLLDYKPLNAKTQVAPLQITSKERKGFTVVEWGGIVR